MTTITQSITPLPVAPDPFTMDRDTFNITAAAFVLAQKAEAVELETFRTQVNTVKGEMVTHAADTSASAATATTQAGNAAASALTALNAPGTNATSTTSDTVALGSTTITIQTGKALVVGMFVLQASTALVSDYMIGQITAYDSGTGVLTHNVLKINGSGTYAAWTISLSPEPDLSGVTAPVGSSLYLYTNLGGM